MLPGLRPHQHLQAGPLVLVGPPAGAGGGGCPGGRLTVEQWLMPKQLSAGGVWWVAGGPPSHGAALAAWSSQAMCMHDWPIKPKLG